MFKIYSSYDCVLKFDDKEEFLDQNTNLTIEEKSKINVYPVGKHSVYSFSLNLDKLEKSKFYKFKNYNDNVYIFFIENLITQTQNLYSYNINNQNCVVKVAKETLTFKTEKIEKEVFLPFNYQEYSCVQKDNLIVCDFNNEETSLIVIFNPKTNKIKAFNGMIQEDDDGFTIKENLFDTKYIFSKEGLKIQSFIENTNFLNKEIIPYNFMNSILSRNFEYAHSLLKDDLKEKITTNNLKEFFPDVKYFKFIEKNMCFAVCEARDIFVKFSINDNKISEIDCD